MIEAILLMVQAPAAAVPMPSFLAGCWQQKQEQRWTEECWTSARGGLMIGSGRSGQDERIVHWEWMRIERGADGVPTFYGSPRGAPPVPFKAVDADADSITFVNPSHDYPQRIRYVRSTEGIDTEISLPDGTRPNRWSYRRSGNPAP